MSPGLPEQWLSLAGCGFVVGFLVGLTGVGAGSLTTPILIWGFAVPPLVAVGTDLLFAAITKASAVWRHHRLGNVDWRIMRILAAGSLPGALAVFVWLHFARPDTTALAPSIRSGLALALVTSAASILIYPWATRRATTANGPCAQPLDLTARRTATTVVLGCLLGCLVALTSVGAGAIGVIALACLLPAMAARRLIGTDIAHAIPLTLACGLGHLALGNIDGALLAALLLGSVPGIALGSSATGLLPDWCLRTLLSGAVLLAAAMVWPR